MTWDKSVWSCEAEYLSAKWRASFYQGSWLLIQDINEIWLMLYMGALVKHVSHHAKLWDKFRPEEDRQKHLEAHGKFVKIPVFLLEPKSNFKEN